MILWMNAFSAGKGQLMDGGGTGWRETMDKYRFSLVLCPADSALASLLRLQPDWTTVEQDDDAVLFRKRT